MAHGIQNKTSTCYISYWHIYPKCRNIWFTIERNEKIQVWKARVRKKEIFLPRIRFGLNIGHRAVKLHKAAKRVPFRIHRFNQIMLVRAALWSMEVETKRTKPKDTESWHFLLRVKKVPWRKQICINSLRACRSLKKNACIPGCCNNWRIKGHIEHSHREPKIDHFQHPMPQAKILSAWLCQSTYNATCLK